MKKILLSLLLLASVNLIFAQTLPCVASFQINNGGGNCPKIVIGGVSTSATGTITLTFDGTIDPNNIPAIGSVTDITDPLNPVLVVGITFGTGTLLNNGNVKFCYYVGPNNNNNLSGQNAQFRFAIFYNGIPCGTQIGLPVSLRAFTATRNNSVVALKWVTSTEVNNSGFVLERLVGSGGWQQIAYVPSQATSGNSSADLTYTYNDLNSTNGVSQYRIKQVDLDNKAKYSDIRAVRGMGQSGKTIIFPNPSNDGKVNIVFEDATATRDITVMDMSGRMVKQMKGVTNNNIQIENLTPGMYSIRVVVRETGDQVVEKIVINNR